MNRVLKIYTRLIFFLLPIFFVPQIYGSFDLAKSGLLIIGGSLGLIIWFVGMLLNKGKKVKWNKLLTWFSILVVWMGVTFVLMSPGARMRSMVLQSGFGVFAALLVWMFLWLQIDSKEERIVQFKWLSCSGLLVALMSLIVFMIPTGKLPLVWPKNNPFISILSQGWSLAGYVLAEAVLMLVLIIGWLKKLLAKLKEKESGFGNYMVEAMGVVFFGLILFLDIYKIIKLGWGYLDTRTAWVVAVEGLKNNPLFGVGIGNFYQAFLVYKPASFNLTSLWSASFESSSMFLLNIWTELGVVGLFWILLGLGSLLKRPKNKSKWVAVVMSLIVVLLPVNLLGLFLLGWILVGSELWTIKEREMKLLLGENGFNLMPYLVGVLLLAGIGYGGYWETRILIADGFWLKSVKAASNNDGSETYNNEIKAIGMNPNMADYRAVYSQTCLALSQNFLNKEDVSDADKESGVALIQQSVREAKSAISLDQLNATYWSNLASIYSSLIGLVEEANTWSIQAYQQAVSLNPSDPMLNLSLGGLYYGLGDYESADRMFEEAVVSKTDYANGWYNWAYSAKQLGKLELAVNRMQQALSLVPSDSSDYETANKVYSEWKEELDEANKKAAESEQANNSGEQTLTTPEALPTGVGENGIESNEGLEPPVEEETLPINEETE